MSKVKYPSIFSPQMEAIVFIILQIFYATHAVLKIGEYPRITGSISVMTGEFERCSGSNIIEFHWPSLADALSYRSRVYTCARVLARPYCSIRAPLLPESKTKSSIERFTINL